MTLSNLSNCRRIFCRQFQAAALVFCISFAWQPSRAVAAPTSARVAESKAIRFTVELTDETKVTGELLDLDSLPLTVDFGEVKIPLRLIHNIQIPQDDSPVKVRFLNGDLLSGRLGVETFVLTTEYGRLTIAVKQIERLTSTQAPAKPTAAAVSRANILHYDDKTWRDETINSSTVTIVTAWAPWAAPSVKTVSVLTKAAGDYRGKLQFVLLDIDRGKRTAEKLGIKAVPTMLVYRDGKLLEKRTGGMRDEAELRQWLDSIYQKHRSRTSNRNPFDDPFRGR